MVDFNKIKEAIAKRDEFLSLHPELIPLQDKINELLSNKTGLERQRILQEIMLNTWYKIVEAWEDGGNN